MKSAITITNLQIECVVGLLSHERTTPQKVRLDVVVDTDFFSSYGQTTTDHVVDWGSLPIKLSNLLRDGKFFLAETACIELAGLVLSEPAAKGVKIVLTKLEAETGAESVAASLQISKEEYDRCIRGVTGSK